MKVLLTIFSMVFFMSVSAQVGHKFIAAGSGMKTIAIVDADGSILWSHPVEGECNDVSMLSDSTVLYSHKTGAKLINLNKEVLWEYIGDKGTEVQSASPLKKGNFLLVQNGTPAKLMEINKKGKIKFEMEIPTVTAKPHGQFRNIRKTKQNTYLVGYFKEQKMCEFDRKGNILRTIKIEGNAFTGIRLANGNTLIACGDGHRLIEVDKDDKVVWSIEENELPNNPLRFVAGVQRLPNGNTVVCNWGGHGHKNGQAQIFEVTPDKKVVWEVSDWKNLRTISTIQLLDVPGKMEKGDFYR